MVSIQEKIRAEMENITTVLTELERVKDEPHKEPAVIVGWGGISPKYIHGDGKHFEQLLLYNKIPIPNTPTWHKDLLNLSVEHRLITGETADKMGKYLFFRHFFTHAYGFLLDEAKLNPLMNNISDVYSEFKCEIDGNLTKIEE